MVPADATYGGITGILQQPVPLFLCPSSPGPKTNQYFRVVGTSASAVTASNGTPSASSGQDYATSNYVMNEDVTSFPTGRVLHTRSASRISPTAPATLSCSPSAHSISPPFRRPPSSDHERLAPLCGSDALWHPARRDLYEHPCPAHFPRLLSDQHANQHFDKPATQVDYSPGANTVPGRNMFTVGSCSHRRLDVRFL